MSLTWIKSVVGTDGGGTTPGAKSDSMVVAESLLMELDLQMKEAEEEKREQEERERRAKNPGIADYSWLISNPPRSYEMPQLERLELETLCMKVKPEESGRVITLFRDSLIRQPTIPEIPRQMRAVILQVLESRGQEDTMSQWMMKSLTKLRPSSRSSSRVTPISDEEGNRSNMVTRLDQLPV